MRKKDDRPFVMSQRNGATSVYHKSTTEMDKRIPTSSQTKTTYLLAPKFPLRGSFVPAKFQCKGASGFDATSFQNNMKCDVDIRKNLCANVVLSCGMTMF